MASLCPFCKEESQITGSNSACSNCGYVFDDSPALLDGKTWTSEIKIPSYGQDVARRAQINRHLYPNIARGRKIGKKLIERTGLILSCNSRIVEDAKLLYDRVFDHKSFHSRRMKTKKCLAAACLYIACRQLNCAMTVRDVADVAQCTASDLDQCKKEILNVFNIEVKSVDVLQLAESRCEKAGLDRDVTSSTVTVIKLCQKLWLSEGRNPGNIVSASSFVAWQGEKPNERLKTKFRSYCNLKKFVFTRHSNILVDLIRSALCDLAKEIPWVESASITPALVSLHFRDIIKFQNTLIAQATAKSMEYSSESSESDISEDESNSEEADKGASVSSSAQHLASRDEMVDRHEGQDVSTVRNLDDEELGNEDVHEDDLHLYIKSGAEIRKEMILSQHL